MRIPTGRLTEMLPVFIDGRSYTFLGALSFEPRCAGAVEVLELAPPASAVLLDIEPPAGAFPDYTERIAERKEANRRRLSEWLTFEAVPLPLLASSGEILDVADFVLEETRERGFLILDITTMPKRFFYMILKRAMRATTCPNLVVTYSYAEAYAFQHLAHDPMPADNLPGFAPPLPAGKEMLVISIGFEPLNLRSLVEPYLEPALRPDLRMIMAFPPNGEIQRRQWRAVEQVLEFNPELMHRERILTVASWDAELVYEELVRLEAEAEVLTLAPFGAKPHALGFALYAIEKGVGVFYTQPKSYDPEYSEGCARTYGYVVKWDGLPCYQR